MDFQEQISIIIPIFNTEEYISECLDTIINQTYKNLEIIIVDDGSTDNSLSICKKYASIDNRIRVYHKENSGVSATRNYGLKKSTGAYISFIDSDDKLCPTMYEVLLKQIQENIVADLIVSSYTLWNSDINEENTIEQKTFGLLLSNDAMENMLAPNGYRGYLWSKLFKKSIIDEYNLQFDPNLKMMEDLHFIVNYVMNIKQVLFINSSFYLYRVRQTSAIKNMPIENHINAFEKIIPLIEAGFNKRCFCLIRWNYYAALIQSAREKKKDQATLKKIALERNFFLTEQKYSLLGYLRKIYQELKLRVL